MTTKQEPVLDEKGLEAAKEWRGHGTTEQIIRAYLSAAPADVRAGWQAKPQHVAYFDDGQFHWMSGIAPRNCELYTRPASPAPAPSGVVEALILMVDAFLSRNGGSFPMDEVTEEQWLWKYAMKAAYAAIGQPRTRERKEKLAALQSNPIAPAGEGMVTEAGELLKRAADHVEMAKAMGNFGIASSLVAELAASLSKQEPVGEGSGWREPDGWKLVPVDPTDAMIDTAGLVDWSNEDERATTINVWHSMIAAAPKQGAK